MEKIKIQYGQDSLQFGNLMLPSASSGSPVVMIIHGGCWSNNYDYTLMDEMAFDLAQRGYVTWNIEYRRIEDEGGGWPGSFNDVANAFKHLTKIAKDYPLDLNNIIVTGHSAGGHLALMLGAQPQIKPKSQIKVSDLPPIKGIISLAGITDLSTYLSPDWCGSNILKLVGGSPDQYPDRYKEGSPITYLPLNIPQKLITGVNDKRVSVDHITPYSNRAKEVGDPIELLTIPDAGHFEVIKPGSVAWKKIVGAHDELRKKR
jgi:acetyl esterase/lipase